MQSEVTCGLPICFPLALAFAIPDRTRVRIMASSIWLNTPVSAVANMASFWRGGGYCPVLYSGRGILHPPHVNRNLVDKNRFIPYIEQGKHSFSSRLTYDKRDTLEEKPVWV